MRGRIRPLHSFLPSALCALIVASPLVQAADQGMKGDRKTSYSPVVIPEDFDTIRKRMSGEKNKFVERQRRLLETRYDLSDRAATDVKMTRGKPVQQGVRVKLPKGMTWEKLASMSPEEIRRQNLFPEGFLPLPHPNHKEGGMVFPQFHIDEVKKQGLH